MAVSDILYMQNNESAIIAKSGRSVDSAGRRADFFETSQSEGEERSFSDAIKRFEEMHKLEAQELKEEKDWRDMSMEEWDEMMESVDQYIDDFKERLRELKEMQDEAAKKAALEAEPEMRAIAASSAALAAASGFVSDACMEEDSSLVISSEEGVHREKNWTKNLETDDQTILMIAQEAQKMERNALSKAQEIQLVGDTEVGISSVRDIIECVSVKEEEAMDDIWSITHIDKEGIHCKKYRDGILISSWELKFSNSEEAQLVEDFISGFKKDENPRFAGSKEFWDEFLRGEHHIFTK